MTSNLLKGPCFPARMTRVARIEDTTVQIWDATNGKRDYTYRGNAHGVRVAWSPTPAVLALPLQVPLSR